MGNLLKRNFRPSWLFCRQRAACWRHFSRRLSSPERHDSAIRPGSTESARQPTTRSSAPTRVQWRGNDVRNLHIVTLELENEQSGKDFENVRLKAYTPAETLILSEWTSVVGSPNVVPSSPEFDARLAVPQGQAPTPAQWNEYNHHREYLLPVVRRGEARS